MTRKQAHKKNKYRIAEKQQNKIKYIKPRKREQDISEPRKQK